MSGAAVFAIALGATLAGFALAAILAAGAQADECAVCECGGRQWADLQDSLRTKGYVVMTPADGRDGCTMTVTAHRLLTSSSHQLLGEEIK